MAKSRFAIGMKVRCIELEEDYFPERFWVGRILTIREIYYEGKEGECLLFVEDQAGPYSRKFEPWDGNLNDTKMDAGEYEAVLEAQDAYDMVAGK